MMLAYRTQLARERAALVGWSVGLLAFYFVIGISYAAVKDHQAGLDQLWDELPQSLRDAFGDVEDITSPGGYFKARATSLLPLVLGGAMAAHATRRLSGAEQARELDLVLSLPIRRATYFWSHWAAGLTHALLYLLAAAAGGIGGMLLAGVDPSVVGRLAYMMAEVLPFVVAVHAGGMLAGAALHRRPPGTAILAGSLAFAFLVQVVAGLDGSVAWMRWLSPYALWARGEPFEFASDPWYFAYCAALVAVCLPLAHRAWARKDFTG